MNIKDYDIVKDIDVLFRKKIIIYGAGHDGKEMYTFLQDAGIGVNCFCDREKAKTEYLSCKVISLEMLKEKAKKEDCLVIVASNKYRENILKDLSEVKITADICTNVGVKIAVDFWVDRNKKFPEDWATSYVKRKNYYIYCMQFALNLRRYEAFYTQKNPIVVYSPQKVGSSTVTNSLRMQGFPAIHIHWLMNLEYWSNLKIEDDVVKNWNNQGAFLKEWIRDNGCKIISLVREPVARAISQYVERVHSERFKNRADDDFEIDYTKKICASLDNDELGEWFNQELKSFTGIDIYEYPFDKEKGYTIIKEGKIEILLLKLENLNENAEVIGEFMGIPQFKFYNENIGDESGSKYIYQEMKKRIRFSREMLEKQYFDNKRISHFYSKEECCEFLKKWEKNIE